MRIAASTPVVVASLHYTSGATDQGMRVMSTTDASRGLPACCGARRTDVDVRNVLDVEFGVQSALREWGQ